MAKPLLPSLAYLDPAWIALAVIQAFRENKSKEPVPFVLAEANSITWATYSKYREDLFDRVRFNWCQLTGKRSHVFPYSEDYVAFLYQRICTKDLMVVTRFEQEIRRRVAKL